MLARESGIDQPTLSEAENGKSLLEVADILAIANATAMPLTFFDPNRQPRKIAEAVLDEYPDMPPEYVRSIETTARMLHREFKSTQSNDRPSRSSSADTSGTISTPTEPRPGSS